MKKYEIWLANLNPQKGTEPGKIRPVVILQTNFLNDIDHPSTIVCPLSTNVLPRETILRVKVSEGLDLESEILVDQIRAIDNKRFISKVGKLKAAKQAELSQKLFDILA